MAVYRHQTVSILFLELDQSLIAFIPGTFSITVAALGIVVVVVVVVGSGRAATLTVIVPAVAGNARITHADSRLL